MENVQFFSGEIIAIENALLKVRDNDYDKDILILTDSKSSCKALKNNKILVHTSDLIYNVKEIIANKETLKKNKRGARRIVIGWIPGHIGIKENEITDTLAKEATNNPNDESIE